MKCLLMSIQKNKEENESSNVGGIAGCQSQLKRKKRKRLKRKRDPKFIDETDDVTRSIIRDSIMGILIEQSNTKSEALDWTLKLFDSTSKRINLYMNYSRMFITDAIKLDDDKVMEMNFERSKKELERIKKLATDLGVLLEKLQTKFNKENKTNTEQ